MDTSLRRLAQKIPGLLISLLIPNVEHDIDQDDGETNQAKPKQSGEEISCYA